MIKVLKPFTTRLQKFTEGDKIAADADLSPHTIASLQHAGYVEAPPSKKPGK